MDELLIKVIPFILPAIMVGSWLVNHEDVVPKKKKGESKSKASGSEKSESKSSDASTSSSNSTSGEKK